MLGDLVTGIFGGLLGGRLSDRSLRRSAARLEQRGQVQCAIRVVDGEHVGLAGKWRHGLADLLAGEIAFDWAAIEVVSIQRGSVRSPTGREAWSVNPQFQIVRVATETATLEWAVPEAQSAWAINTVMPS
jgi:hypothetical protein